jgi:hypothetical protein
MTHNEIFLFAIKILQDPKIQNAQLQIFTASGTWSFNWTLKGLPKQTLWCFVLNAILLDMQGNGRELERPKNFYFL